MQGHPENRLQTTRCTSCVEFKKFSTIKTTERELINLEETVTSETVCAFNATVIPLSTNLLEYLYRLWGIMTVNSNRDKIDIAPFYEEI